MIEPKEDMMVLARLVRQMENVILDLERHLALIASLEEGLDAKADKIDLQAKFDHLNIFFFAYAIK